MVRLREVDSDEGRPAAPVAVRNLLSGVTSLGSRMKLASSPAAALGQVATGNPQCLLRIQGAKDDLAVPITVFYDVKNLVCSGAPATVIDTMYLRVSWGVGAYSTYADVDLGFGGHLTVFGSSVSVDVYTPAQIGGQNYSVEVGAYAVPGSRPGGYIGPTRTLALVNASGGAAALAIGDSTSLLEVPPYASQVSFIANPTDYTTTPEFGLVFANSAGTEIARLRYGSSMHSTQLHTASPAALLAALWQAPRFKVINSMANSVAMARLYAVFGLNL